MSSKKSKKVRTRIILSWCDGSRVVDADGVKESGKKITQMIDLVWLMVEANGAPTVKEWYVDGHKKTGSVPPWAHMVGITVEQKPKKRWEQLLDKTTTCAHQASQ